MPEIIKEIKITLETRYNGPDTTRYSIRRILKEAGYKDKDITRMAKNDQIAIIPTDLRPKVRAGQRLVIIESLERPDPKETFHNRFSNLETD